MGLPVTFLGPSLGLRIPHPGRKVAPNEFSRSLLGQAAEAKSRHRQAGSCCFVG